MVPIRIHLGYQENSPNNVRAFFSWSLNQAWFCDAAALADARRRFAHKELTQVLAPSNRRNVRGPAPTTISVITFVIRKRGFLFGMMSLVKSIISVIAIVLAFVAYIPYIQDIRKGKTKPHSYSWFVWGLLAVIIFALQVKGGGGVGAYVTLSAAIITFFVFFLSLKNGKNDITLSDTVFFVSSLIALGLWLFAKQPTLSMILLVTIDMLGFIPTVRKSWRKPYEETAFTWGLNGFRYCLAIAALNQYNLLTLLYPVAWAVGNILLTIMLVSRRSVISA